MLQILISYFFLFFIHNYEAYPECPNGAVNDGTLCYKRLPDPWESNYAEAELGCNLTYGGNLMRIGNALANSIACDLADKKRASVGTDIYVGARRINNVWSLPDGLPLPYINWYPGQPENTSGYDCVMLNLYHTSWYATTCDQYARNICTFPIKK